MHSLTPIADRARTSVTSLQPGVVLPCLSPSLSLSLSVESGPSPLPFRVAGRESLLFDFGSSGIKKKKVLVQRRFESRLVRLVALMLISSPRRVTRTRPSQEFTGIYHKFKS